MVVVIRVASRLAALTVTAAAATALGHRTMRRFWRLQSPVTPVDDGMAVHRESAGREGRDAG